MLWDRSMSNFKKFLVNIGLLPVYNRPPSIMDGNQMQISPKTKTHFWKMARTAICLEMCAIKALGQVTGKKRSDIVVRKSRQSSSSVLAAVEKENSRNFKKFIVFHSFQRTFFYYSARKILRLRLISCILQDVCVLNDCRFVWKDVTKHYKLSRNEYEKRNRFVMFVGCEWRTNFFA